MAVTMSVKHFYLGLNSLRASSAPHSVCLCVWARVCCGACVASESEFSHCVGPGDRNSGHQAWQHVLLSAKPSCQPGTFSFLNCVLQSAKDFNFDEIIKILFHG